MSQVIDESLLTQLHKYMDISGIECEDVKPHIIFWEDERRTRSALLGEHIKPCKAYPEGCIILHLDAIKDYALHTGYSMLEQLLGTLFHEIHHWITWRDSGNIDELKAELYTRKHFQKLINRKKFNRLPPLAVGPNWEQSARSLANWIKRWTGMSPVEWYNYTKAMKQ